MATEDLQNVPFVVLGNKIDLPNSISEYDLRVRLNLVETTGKDVFPLRFSSILRSRLFLLVRDLLKSSCALLPERLDMLKV